MANSAQITMFSSSWQPDVKIDETTGRYFRLAGWRPLAPPENSPLPTATSSPPTRKWRASAAADWLFQNEPRHASMARTSVSPNIFTGGYRSNVIPSEAKARLDVRMVPGEDAEALLAQIRKAMNDTRRWTCSSPGWWAAAARAGHAPGLGAVHDGGDRRAGRLQGAHGALDEHLRHRHDRCAPAACSASGSAPAWTSRISRPATACTPTRSACSRASSSASCGSTGRLSRHWPAPGERVDQTLGAWSPVPRDADADS